MKYLINKLSFCTVVFFTVAVPAIAQYTSDKGFFEINAKEACAGALITVVDNCVNCSYFDFGTGEGPYGLDHQYNEPGTYTILALAAGGVVEDQVTITIYQDTIPQFNMYRCGGRGVEVKINDDNYDSYKIEWGDGTEDIISGSDTEELHTFASAGNYNVTVTGLYDLGSGNDSCSPNRQAILIEDNPPVATINQIYPPNNQSDRVVIKYSAPPNALYKLQLAINNSNNWIPAQDIVPSNDSIVVTNLLLDQNYYCFRIATLEACQTGNPPNAYSAALCTQDLDVEFTTNEENILTWRTSNTTGVDFNIIIDEEGSISTRSYNISRRTYNHNVVTCNTDYCYTLVTNYPGGATVTSLKKCGTAELVTNLPPVSDMVTLISGSEVILDWPEAPDPDNVQFYNVFRSINNENYTPIGGNISGSQFTDTGLSPSQAKYCYQVNYTDRCDNVSPNSEFCAIYLRGSPASLELIQLTWNAYDGYSDGVSEYRVEKFDENDNILGTFYTTDPEYTDTLDISDPQELRYRVTAIPNDGSFENSVSNIFSIIRQVILNAPNAFTPGSAGVNSVFKIISPFLSQIDMKIFNRWGELVYHINDLDTGWPGNDMDGNPLPQGTYIYKAELVFESGIKTTASGGVLLLRR